MTRGSFSTTICHNGGDGFRQREQGYHISSVGRRYEDSLFSWAGTDGRSRLSAHRFCVWYHTLRPSFRCLYLHAAPPAIRAFAVSALARETVKLSCIRYRYHTQNASTLGQLRPDREGNLNIKEMLKILKKYKLAKS